MNEKYLLKEDKNMTKVAKNIFGDIVNNAYYAEINYSFIPEEETILKLDKLILNSVHKEEEIDQDAKVIVIEFINGKRVIFHNSEWGSMSALKSEEIKKII